MEKSWHIKRRTFLRGLGTSIALPVLDQMLSSKALAAGDVKAFPKRMAFLYVPNGANMSDWTPKSVGSSFQLPYILKPLQPHQSDLTVLTGLAHDKARANGDGAGDHARANASFLTGCQARKTSGADIKIGVSVDQIAANKIGAGTRFPSLEFSSDGQRLSGNCDSGYSCAYQFNLAWKSENTPAPPESNPRAVFDRLFGNHKKVEMTASRIQRDRYQKSILDFVLEDANSLRGKLGYSDKRKLDEYMTAIREVEQQMNAAAASPVDLPPGYVMPLGKPNDNEAHLRLMMDMLALAFQTDSTRVITYLLAHDGSNRSYPLLGIKEGHHELSHHGNNEEKKQKIAKINRFHATQLAYLLGKLKAVKEGNGTLLDNCMIVYGSGIGDGNRHNHNDLPVLLLGKGGGTIKPGRHLRFPDNTPMTNLYLAMLDRMGVPAERIGDSTGRLQGLA